MDIVALLGLVLVVGSVAAVVGLGRRHAWRWGEVPEGAAQAGEGAYRASTVHVVRPRGVPPLVSWSAGLGYVWAALTFFVFAPAGLLLAVLVGMGPRALLGGLLVAALCATGFALAIMLVVAGTALLRCRPKAAELARRIAWWSLVHHVVVVVVMVGVGLGTGWEPLGGVAAVPCLLGALHALLLLKAGRLPEPAVPNAPEA